MLNNKLKLNPKIFDADVEQVPIRNGFGEGLLFLGDHNANVVALSADLTESTRTEAFAKKFPDRSFEVGVAEQNMATIAAGLGISGKIPFIASYATFSPGRNYEQIRTTIAYNNSNVKIAGHHAGVSVGPDGATHQATEDIAIMRAMPNMLVFVPCDAIEAKKATIAAAAIDSPVYIRFAREKSAVVTTEETPFTPGKIDVFWESRKPQVAIIACGLLMRNALLAAKELEKEKIGVLVLNNHSVKPMDEKAIVKAAERTGAVVTVEEHQIAGGMGSAVAEILAKHHPTPIEFVGMRDTFGESGPPEALIEKYGMGVKDIKDAVKKVISRK
ncbi:transketolase family protein [Patescibacteria group bacterium]|nr:transketolase family protein [Patescibacteria group bacterium]MCL5114876.1 transketolase family protein [Patescibacteria group bacterium]